MEYKIKIKCNNEYRSFPKNYTVTLDYNDTNVISLMGKNGCGKSTLIQAIRGVKNSNKDVDTKWNAKRVCEEISKNFDVTVEGFKNIYHLDSDGLDNTTSMFNAASADDFVELGGWQTRNMSAGEKSFTTLGMLKKNVTDSEDTLIILDEFDNHLDYDFRINFIKWINGHFPLSKKLVVTHDLLSTCLGNGNVVMLPSTRTPPNEGFKPMLIGSAPDYWKNEQKEILFRIYTGCTLKKPTKEDLLEEITELKNKIQNKKENESKD